VPEFVAQDPQRTFWKGCGALTPAAGRSQDLDIEKSESRVDRFYPTQFQK
jgi:hypothetical protein